MNRTKAAMVGCGLFLATFGVQAADLATRYGKLSVGDDNNLTFDGKNVVPSVQGNNGLAFLRNFQIGESDITLVQDHGGTACPALYYFITTSAKKGAISSPSFGTCSDLVKIRQDGDAIVVTMAGFQGPFEPPAKQAVAARQQHEFTFIHGQLLAEGKAVKPETAQQSLDAVASAPGPTVSRQVHFDPPLKEQIIPVLGHAGQPDSKVRCVFYKDFMIREVHSGDDIGTASLSVVSTMASETSSCSAEKAAHEKNLMGHGGMEFVGASGRFLLLIWPDGANGATAFSIFDAITTRKLYNDAVKDGVDGFTSFVPVSGAEVLNMSFERVVAAPCSLAGVDAFCWGRFGQQAKLPTEITKRSPPVTACADAYAKRKLSGPDLSDPSVVSYKAVMAVAVDGAPKVISRGELSCWPAE